MKNLRLSLVMFSFLSLFFSYPSLAAWTDYQAFLTVEDIEVSYRQFDEDDSSSIQLKLENVGRKKKKISMLLFFVCRNGFQEEGPEVERRMRKEDIVILSPIENICPGRDGLESINVEVEVSGRKKLFFIPLPRIPFVN